MILKNPSLVKALPDRSDSLEEVFRFSLLLLREKFDAEEKYERMFPMTDCSEWPLINGARVGRHAAIIDVLGSMADQMIRLAVSSTKHVSRQPRTG